MPKFLLVILLTIVLNGCKAQNKNWTFLYYAAGSNSSEIDLLNDVDEMIRGKLSDDYNLVLLIDRIEGHSEDSLALGQNFIDTKLYEITTKGAKELNGAPELPQLNSITSYDVNMGDAKTLKDFIRFGKNHFPAEHYMLIMRSHGNGMAMCPDIEEATPDRIFPAEMTDILTENESVDILGLDVCSMAEIENYYQWRPNNGRFSANYIIASAPLSAAWAYDRIFGRMQEKPLNNDFIDDNYFSSGKEDYISPNTVSPKKLALMFMEEIYDSQRWASWALFDNSKIENIKNKIDDLAKLLAKEKKESIYSIIDSALAYYHNTNNDLEVAQLTFPYVDANDFFERVSQVSWSNNEINNTASFIVTEISEATMASYYGNGYLPQTENFTNGRNGVSIILPSGHKTFSKSGRNFWAHTTWFSPEDKTSIDNAYGKYSWCSENAIPKNAVVDNWFELLDSIFDTNDTSGGVNGYGY